MRYLQGNTPTPSVSPVSALNIKHQIGSKEGESGFCSKKRNPQNPNEIALPTSSEVFILKNLDENLSFDDTQGWGFCHQACDKNYNIFGHQLKKVRLTILSEELCKISATVDEDNLGVQIVVNTRKELCGAFVNSMNVTFVNYTLSKNKGKQKPKKS